jgi:hypothetical protein
MTRWRAVLLLACEVMVCNIAALGQTGGAAITPEKVSMLVGEMHEFKAVNGVGRSLTRISWKLSNSGVAELTDGDRATVTATHPGKVTLSANAAEGSAEAQIEVLEGTTRPPGSIKWGGAEFPGCRSAKAIPAVPSPSGVDVFEQSQCSDGEYISAYTSDGILVWRRQISSNGQQATASVPEIHNQSTEGLDAHVVSICDSVSVGLSKNAVGALLNSRKLEHSSEPGDSWLVEENGANCKLWFGTDDRVSRRRKTLTSD